MLQWRVWHEGAKLVPRVAVQAAVDCDLDGSDRHRLRSNNFTSYFEGRPLLHNRLVDSLRFFLDAV
jgi:hypothetical protein